VSEGLNNHLFYLQSIQDQGSPSHPEATQSQRKRKGTSKRKKYFTLTEDETLCSAYLNMSKDPIVGVNQSMQTYWGRITDYYNDNRKNSIERTQNSLQHRWSDIQKNTT
jgi:hypothetical protein